MLINICPNCAAEMCANLHNGPPGAVLHGNYLQPDKAGFEQHAPD